MSMLDKIARAWGQEIINDLEHVLIAVYATEILLILKRHRRTVSQLSGTVQLDMHKTYFQVVIIALNCR